MTAEGGVARRSFVRRAASSTRGWIERLRGLPVQPPRWARIGFLALAAAWAVYVLATSVLLGTGALRSLLRSPETLQVDYDSAYSLLPGRVVVRGLSLRFQDDHVRFHLQLDRARFDVDLFALSQRTFHVRRIDAHGASFRVVHKVSREEGGDARLEAFPEIPGFEGPPLRRADEGTSPPSEPRDLWTVHLDEVTAAVRELWLMEYRYVGSATVTGGFRLQPLRRLFVAPSALRLAGGQVRVGGEELAVDVLGALEAEVADFDVQQVTGAGVLREVSARADLVARVSSLAPVSELYTGPRLAVSGGRGPFSLEVRLDRGVLSTDSRLAYRTGDASARWGPVRGRARLVVLARAGQGAQAPIALSVRAEDVEADVREQHALRAATAVGTLTLTSRDLDPLPSVASIEARIRSFAAPDLAALSALLPPKAHLLGGSAGAELELDYRPPRLDARIDARFRDAHMRRGSVAIRADGRAWLTGSTDDVARGVGLPSAGVDLSRASMALGDEEVRGLSVHVEAERATLSTSGALSADLAVRATPGEEPLGLLAAAASLPEWVGEAAGGSTLTARARVRAGGGAAALELVEAESGSLSAAGALRDRGPRATGAFLFEAGPLSVGVAIDGGASIHPMAGDAWLREHTDAGGDR